MSLWNYALFPELSTWERKMQVKIDVNKMKLIDDAGYNNHMFKKSVKANIEAPRKATVAMMQQNSRATQQNLRMIQWETTYLGTSLLS